MEFPCCKIALWLQCPDWIPENESALFLSQVKIQSKVTAGYLTEEEPMRMINLTTSLRDLTILKVLYSGGFRVSDLVGRNWGEVQVFRPIITTS